MDITTTNQILFPVFLFVVIFSSFYFDTDLFNRNSISNCSPSELELFFEKVSQDSILINKLETIIEKENFIEQIVIFGNTLGYDFTASDVRQSIVENTANPNGSYICLPLGCWEIG